MPKPGAPAASSRAHDRAASPRGGGRIGRHRAASHIGATAISASTTDRNAAVRPRQAAANPQSAARHSSFRWK